MKWYVIGAFAFAALFAMMDARAEFYSGNDLHRFCTGTDYHSKGTAQVSSWSPRRRSDHAKSQ
jgi:hypothetical protein